MHITFRRSKILLPNSLSEDLFASTVGLRYLKQSLAAMLQLSILALFNELIVKNSVLGALLFICALHLRGTF